LKIVTKDFELYKTNSAYMYTRYYI